MENEIMEKVGNNILTTINKGDTTIHLSPEAMSALVDLGRSALGEAIQVSKELLIDAVRNELELQIKAMEQTTEGQKNVLDEHESAQHDLLQLCQKVLESIAAEKDEKMKAGYIEVLKDIQQSYRKNNDTLEENLKNTKQEPKGILDRFLHRIRR